MKFGIIFSDGVGLGGVETSSLRLAQALQKCGHEVRLLIHGSRDDCHPLLRKQIEALPHRYLPALNEESFDFAGAYAEEAPATLIPNQSAKAYPHLRAAKTRLDATLNILGICHSDYPDYYELADNYQDIVDVQFGVSRHICKELDKRLKRPSRLLILGLDVPETLPSRKPGKHLRILYTGRIENYGKRCCELIPAGEVLRRSGVKFRMTMAGDGPYLKWLREDRSQVPLFVRHRYRIPGAVSPDDIEKLYRTHDIYLSFTRFEGNSISVMEAMAQGCVPVLPRVSGTETVIEHMKTGWLGEVDCPETLIEGCRTLYQDHALRQSMAEAAHQYAKSHCDVKETVRVIEESLDH